jgi:hypothetical protein
MEGRHILCSAFRKGQKFPLLFFPLYVKIPFVCEQLYAADRHAGKRSENL